MTPPIPTIRPMNGNLYTRISVFKSHQFKVFCEMAGMNKININNIIDTIISNTSNHESSFVSFI